MPAGDPAQRRFTSHGLAGFPDSRDAEPVAGVSAHHAGKNFIIYVIPSTLKPVGTAILYDAQRDEVSSG